MDEEDSRVGGSKKSRATTPASAPPDKKPVNYLVVGSLAGVGLIALCAILFVIWYSGAKEKERIAKANAKVEEAIVYATAWLDGDESIDFQKIEDQLDKALKNNDATNRAKGIAIQLKAKRRFQKLEEQRSIESKFLEAKSFIAKGQVKKAVELLQDYVANSKAKNMQEASELLKIAQFSISGDAAMEHLRYLPDRDFENFQRGNYLSYENFEAFGLKQTWLKTLNTHAENAATARREQKIEAEKRKKAAEIAARKREQAERAVRQKAEIARREEQARLARARANPPQVRLEDIENFPDRYYGQFVVFRGVQIGGDDVGRASEEFGDRWVLGLRSARKKMFFGKYRSSPPVITVPERFAEEVINRLENNTLWFNCNVYAEVVKGTFRNDTFPWLQIYKIEVINRGGNIGTLLE